MLLLQFAVTKAAGSNPNFHLGGRFCSGVACVIDGWTRLHRPNEKRRPSLNWTLCHGGKAASKAEEDQTLTLPEA